MNSLLLISNYFNAHQLGLATQLHRSLGDGFHFVSLQDELSVVGRPSLDSQYDYVLKEYEPCDKAAIRRHIREDDMVIFGDMGLREDLVFRRDFTGRPYLRYAERPFKAERDKSVFNRLKTTIRFARIRHGMSVLCAGAYVVDDLTEVGFPADRCFSWGYFPKFDNRESVLRPRASADGLALVWVGRFIDWKRPEWAVRLAYDLKNRSIPFHLTMIGDGPLFDVIREALCSDDVDQHVRLAGLLSPEEVFEELERADVYLMTSNHQEGWGVSLNEAMHARCAPVACKSAGSVPFLIKDGINGRSYEPESYDGFLSCVLAYAKNPSLVAEHAENAHATVDGPWGAKKAAESLLELSDALIAGTRTARYTGYCCQNLGDYSNGLGGNK